MSRATFRLILIASLTAVFGGLVSPPLWADEKPAANVPLPVKIMSFNIRLGSANDGPNRWSNRRELVAETIRSYAPDFLGTQEAMLDQVSYLRKQFPQYECLAVFREKVPLTGEASALFYRRDRWRLDPDEQGTFWLSETPDVRGSKSWKTACTRIVTWGRFIEKFNGDAKKGSPRAVYVYNTHFDHMSKLAREKSAQMIARRIAERQYKDPVVLMGDLNAGESSRPIEYLTGRLAGSPLKMLDTFRILHPRAENSGTFCAFKGKTSGNKIDYIFVLPGTKVLVAEIVRDNRDGQYPSDHFPVTASLELPANQRAYGGEDIKFTPDVVYGHKHGLALTFDVFCPQTNPNGAGVLFMVSGGWRSHWHPPEKMLPLFRALCHKGYAVFAVRHGSSPKFTIPEIAADVRRSVRYIRLNAKQWGVDPQRLGVLGGSAGGHLSLILATTSDAGNPQAKDPVLRMSDRVAAVVAIYPPTDIRPFVTPKSPFYEKYPALQFNPAKAAEFSPVANVSKDDPPTLLIHGDQDKLVEIDHSLKILKAFQQEGVTSKLVTIEGAGHGFHGHDKQRATQEMIAWFEKFLKKPVKD